MCFMHKELLHILLDYISTPGTNRYQQISHLGVLSLNRITETKSTPFTVDFPTSTKCAQYLQSPCSAGYFFFLLHVPDTIQVQYSDL